MRISDWSSDVCSSDLLHMLPPAAFRALLSLAHAGGVARGFGSAALARMRDDLVFDIEPARRDFGYAPRPFEPEAAMFGRARASYFRPSLRYSLARPPARPLRKYRRAVQTHVFSPPTTLNTGRRAVR